MRILLTHHAQEKMALLGIHEEQLIECIQKGAKTRQTDGWLSSFTYIKVAYKFKPDGTCKVKTVFIE